MKPYYLFISLFALSAILMIDYMLVVVIGITAKLFGASIGFYELVYPYIIGIIVVASIVGLIVVFLKHAVNQKRNGVVHSIISHHSVLIDQTA